MGRSSDENYGNFFRHFISSCSNDYDVSDRNQSFLQNSYSSNDRNQYQNHGGFSSPMINQFQTPIENLLGNSSETPNISLMLQNSAALEMHADTGVAVNPCWEPEMEKLMDSSIILNSFQLQRQTSHPVLPNMEMTDNDENVWGSNFSFNKLLEEEAIHRMSPREDVHVHVHANQTESAAVEEEIFEEKDDFSLSFIYSQGLKYCAKFDKIEQITSNIMSVKERSTNGAKLIMAKRSKEAIKQRALKIHDLSAGRDHQQPKTSTRGRKPNTQKFINFLKDKNQVGSSSSSRPAGHKEPINDTSKKITEIPPVPSFFDAADKNLVERSYSPIPSSISPPTIARGSNVDSIRSGTPALPVKIYGGYSTPAAGSSSFDGKYKRMSNGGTSLYHGASRLSRTSAAFDYNDWKTMPSTTTNNYAEIETRKWQPIHLEGGSNWKGTNIGDQQIGSFFGGQNNQSFPTIPSLLSATENGIGIQTRNFQETTNNVTPDATQVVAKVLNLTRRFGSAQTQQLGQLNSTQPSLFPPHETPFFQNMDFAYQIPQHDQYSYNIPNSPVIPFVSGDGPKYIHSSDNIQNYNEVGNLQKFQEWRNSKGPDDAILEYLGIKIDTAEKTSNNAAISSKLGEKELEAMVNWPEYHLMGTDRFGFDI